MDVEGVRMNAISTQTSSVQHVKAEPEVASKAAAAQASVKNESFSNKVSVVKSINNSKEENIDEDSISDRLLGKAVTEANKKLKSVGRSLQCSFHEETNRIMVKVIDTETNEVIREIPPEKTLDAFVKVLEMAGLLVDERS